MARRFPLAPMSFVNLLFTLFAGVLVAVFFYAGIREPEFGRVGFAAGFLIILLVIAVLLFMRPLSFNVSADALTLEWPLRARNIPRSALADVRVMTRRELKEEVGFMVRLGVGGLFGEFGWMLTPRGRYEVWRSTFGDCVLLKRNDGGLPLILTPADPEALVRALMPRD